MRSVPRAARGIRGTAQDQELLVVLLPTKVSISASPAAATLPCPSHASHRKHKGVDVGLTAYAGAHGTLRRCPLEQYALLIHWTCKRACHELGQPPCQDDPSSERSIHEHKDRCCWGRRHGLQRTGARCLGAARESPVSLQWCACASYTRGASAGARVSVYRHHAHDAGV